MAINVRQNGMINEIKFLRERWGLSLLETKNIVEQVARSQDKEGHRARFMEAVRDARVCGLETWELKDMVE